jgi:serine/threonine-protein kinase
MGTVWEGVHQSLGTRVAVKFIDAEYAASDDVRQRFVNEARAAARLRSKHVVQVYDQGVGEDGRPYIVMEFLAGEPLDNRLDRQGRLAPLETARIALHVCRALAKAHESGIVHRDLKPENVFIVHDEEDATDIAKVVDFGIAKIADPGGTGSSSTRTGAVLGTPQYMSPEQARGLRSVDHRTDLWSLGVIVYRAIVGVLPFKGEAVGDLLVNICTGDPPVPSSLSPDVPPGFDDWMKRALAREPADRFQTAAELTDSLAVLCGLDARLGGAPPSRDWPSSRDAGAKGAVTAAPFAATPAPSARPAAARAAGLAVLFVVVVAATVVGARAVLHAGPEPAAQASATPAAPSPAPVLSAPPEVTPAMAAPTPAAPEPLGEPSARRATSAAEAAKRAHPRGAQSTTGGAADRPRPLPTEGPGAKSARPPDLLGY